MRSSLSLLSVVLVGCVSSWSGPPFDNQFATRPYWPDCDGDAWGDRDIEPVCVNPQDSPPPDCGGTPGVWVDNHFDCDDAYDLSGSLVGSACPGDFDAYLGVEDVLPTDYALVPAGAREFLVWRGLPVHSAEAHLICESWAAPFGEPPALPDGVDPTEVAPWLGARDPAPEDPAASVPLLGLPEVSQQLSPIVNHITGTWGDPSWRGWIDVGFDGTGWAMTGPTEPPDALDFCPSEFVHDLDGDGLIHPTEIYQGLVPGDASAEFIEDMFGRLRLVLRIQEGAVPCLEAPVSLCVDPQDCVPRADILCERPLQTPNGAQGRALFALSDLQCEQGT